MVRLTHSPLLSDNKSDLAHNLIKNSAYLGKDMSEKILFSLENCMKCTQTKELLTDRDDIKIVTYPHDISDWNDEHLNEAKTHGVFEDLQRTAPILWLGDEKKIGYLRIRKWLQDNKK